MSEKLDRRKAYTRMVLKNSLIKLLTEKQISAITVKEICHLADINRSTFYAHYTDQYDLLNQVEDEILNEMEETLGKYNFRKEEEAIQMLEKMLDYIANNVEVCQALLSENGNTTFQNKVMNFAREFIFKNIKEITQLDRQVSEYITVFIVSGSIHIIKKWLANGMDKSPKELAEIINHLTNKGLFNTIDKASFFK